MKFSRLFFKMFVIMVVFILLNCDNSSEPVTQPGDPQLSASPSSLQLTGNPMVDVITISNKGGGQVTWNVTSSPSWLTVSPKSGEVDTTSMSIHLITEFEMLEYGEFDGTVKIESNASSAEIAVSLSYSAPKLKIGTTVLNLDRHYSYGDFIIENSGGGGLEWEITESPSWLEFDALSDIVYGPSQAVPFRVNFQTVEYGEFEGSVQVESNGGAATVNAYLSYFREEEVYPGIGAANIELDYAYSRVKKIWGNPDRNWYARPEKTVFIHYFTYDNLGLLFSVQNNSPILYGNGPVGYINVSAPYDGLTVDKRIGIGSSLVDLLAAYENPTSIEDNLYYYDIGITFEVKNDSVTAMIIE